LLILNKSEGSSLKPPVIPLFENYGGRLWHIENGYPHPTPGLNLSWRQVLASLEDFLDVYDCILQRPFGEPPEGVGKLEDRLLTRYADFLYRAVEFTETAADKTKFAVVDPSRLKQKWGSSRIAGLRRHADIICNKLKHNQHRLIQVSAKHLQGRVEGYMVVYVSTEEVVVPNADIHKDREALSFNLDVRKVMANIYLISQEIQIISATATDASTKTTGGFDADTESALTRLSALPNFVFPGETVRHMPVFEYQDGILRVDDRGGPVRHSFSTHQFRTRYISDGYTQVYRVPFMAGGKKTKI
jgi:hypothetical protein